MRFGVIDAHRLLQAVLKTSIGAVSVIGVNNVQKIMIFVSKLSKEKEVNNDARSADGFSSFSSILPWHLQWIKTNWIFHSSVGYNHPWLFEHSEQWLPYRLASWSLRRLSASFNRSSIGPLCVQQYDKRARYPARSFRFNRILLLLPRSSMQWVDISHRIFVDLCRRNNIRIDFSV